jgi:Domain of unknown function (DUF5911)
VERYPNISDHGIIGDLQTAALVTTDGTVDFFCCPRFDSPSVFASLLDTERGGQFSIKPAAEGCVTRQLYLPDTAMLITRFMTPDGVGEVLDFMPVIEGEPTDRHRLVRHLRVARGVMRFELEIQPRFDYGRVGQPRRGTRIHGRQTAVAGSGRTRRDGRRHGGVPEGMAWPLDVHRPVARDGRPLRYDPQAAHLRAHRGRRSRPPRSGCPSRPVASGTGTTALPGSGTDRCPCTPWPGWAISRRPAGSLCGSATGSPSAWVSRPVR